MMAHVISFRTARFDVTKERHNPINPIAGQSVLDWLRGELAKAGYDASEPDTEDWGWYIGVQREGARYLVGASADAEDTGAEVEWVVQVHKSRSVKERLLGRNEMPADDPLSALIESLVRAAPDMNQVSIDREH